MIQKLLIFGFFILLFFNLLHSETINLKYSTELEEQLFDAFIENHSFNVDTLSCWLISQGYSKTMDIDESKNMLSILIEKIDKEINPKENFKEKAEDIFLWMHKNVMKKFDQEAKIIDLFLNGDYNLINANAIYYLICSYYNIPITLIINPYYLKTRLEFLNNPIEIDILDSKDGFDSENNKQQFVDYLLLTNIIEKSEFVDNGIAEIYDYYFSNYIKIKPYDLTGYIYYKKGIAFLKLSNFNLSTQNFEKAILVNPNNEFYLHNYKISLSILKDNCINYSQFLPYFRNSLYLLSSDPSYSNFAAPVAIKTVMEIVDEHRDFPKALELLLQFKTTYLNDNFLMAVNKTEDEIEYGWLLNLMMNGEVESAYEKILMLYKKGESPKKYEELYVQVSLSYAKMLIYRKQDYVLANQIMDSLLIYSDNYSTIIDNYIYITLAPFQFEYRYAENNPSKAMALAHKVYKYAPRNNVVQRAMSEAYHQKAMAHIRENNLKKAHRILVKGLKFVPNDKLLEEDLEQLEEAY